jgi:DNA-binding transcriptional MerR regulator
MAQCQRYDPRVADPELELDVDELARRAGTTVRNVRLYQERGLLPKPERRGRRAVYSEEHLSRLQLVLRLMGRGYSLAAIKDLTEAWDRDHDLGHVLGLKEAVGTRFNREDPLRVTLEELRALYPYTDEDLDETIERDTAMGILVRDGDDFVIPSPAFFTIGATLVEAGIPMLVVEAMAERILTSTRQLADGFVGMFLEQIWAPYDAAGKPPEEAAHVLELIDRLSPLVSEATIAALGLSMQERIDQALMGEINLD